MYIYILYEPNLPPRNGFLSLSLLRVILAFGLIKVLKNNVMMFNTNCNTCMYIHICINDILV